MNILFLGDLHPFGRCYQRKRAMEEMGLRVEAHRTVPAGQLPGQKGSLLDRVSARLRLPVDFTGANRAVVRAARRSAPDIIWIEKGNTIWPGTLRAVRSFSPGTRLVSISEDDMFAPHNHSRLYRWGLKYYDVVFTTKSYNCDPSELPALGARRVVFVENAYDPHLHRPVPLTSEDRRNLGSEVGFIGSFEAERASSLAYLARHGVPTKVWGTGWRKWRGRLSNLIVQDRPVYGDDYAKAICATRINLCFLRRINRDRQTSRSVEIPACGAFMLAERTREHLSLFEEGKEATFFDSPEELLSQVRYYSDHDEERRAIASAGRRRCLASGYSHNDRLRFMLSVVPAG